MSSIRPACTRLRLSVLLFVFIAFALVPQAFAVTFGGVADLQIGLSAVTALTFGPEDPDPLSNADGCIYAAMATGEVNRICFDAAKAVTSNVTVVDLNGVGTVGNILGITIDPIPLPATSIELYIAYSIDNSAPFNGRIARAVSVDGGVSFTTDEVFITGLGRSSFDHQTNGLDIGPDGCLYVSQGNNSNAGYDSEHAESRLSSGVLRACFKALDGTVDPAFDRNCGDGNSQEACGVEVYASGLRNPYDITWHSNGRLYNTDNDSNPGFRDNCGAEANNFGCGCQAPIVTPQGDELNLIQQGKYYGSPNPYIANPSSLQCNGGTDGGDSCAIDADCAGGGLCQDLSALCTGPLCGEAALCEYFGEGEPPGGGEDPNSVYVEPIAQVPALLDGLSEYRSRFNSRNGGSFCSDWNGDLLATGGPGVLRRFDTSVDGLSVTDQGNTNLNGIAGLDNTVGPDGTIYAADFSGSKVTYIVPVTQSNALLADYFSFCSTGEVCGSAGACEVDTDNDGIADGDDLFPADPRNLGVGPVAIDGNTGNPIRLNANTGTDACAGTKVDCNGDTWLGDFGYNEPLSAFTCGLTGGCAPDATLIFGCTDANTEALFLCEHWDAPTSPELAYDFDVPDGEYIVNVLLMNAFDGTALEGERVFDIRAEGAVVHAAVDQVAIAGGSGIPAIRSALVTVADGNGLQLEFGHVIENPAIKAIEVLTVANCVVDLDCNDANTCTNDTCNAGLCQYVPNTDPCDDGLSCTSGDVCGSGVCGGTDSCTGNFSCNAQSDSCELPPILERRINVNGALHAGTDFPGTWEADSGVGGICTVNAYSTANPISGTVDDALFSGEVWGNPVVCNVDDSGSPLADGTYTVNLLFAEIYQGPGCPGGGTGPGQRVFDIQIEGNTLETGVDLFTEGGCAASTTVTTGTPVTRSFDVAVSDGSVTISLPATADNAKISAIEVLGGPQCSVNADCNDGDTCTDDVCNAGICEFAFNVDPCDDGDACTSGDTCSAGVCVAGGPLACDDGNTCNGAESCDSGFGCVAGTPLSCDDSDACNGSETCDPVLGCQAGTPLSCDDGSVCTGTESCDPGLGCVAGVPLVCDDGDTCTGIETCDALLGCQSGTPANCDDGDACTGIETCDPGLGCQSGTTLDCDDLDECTADSCDAIDGCVHDPIPGCGVTVPVAGQWGQLILAMLMLLGAGFALTERRDGSTF